MQTDPPAQLAIIELHSIATLIGSDMNTSFNHLPLSNQACWVSSFAHLASADSLASELASVGAGARFGHHVRSADQCFLAL